MGTIKFDVPDEMEDRFREWAMKRFGHKRGSLGKAGQEALSVWVAEQDIELDLKPAHSPLTTKRGSLSHVELSSTELKHSVGETLLDQHRGDRDENK